MIDIAVIGALGFGKGFITEVVSNGKDNGCRLSAIVDVSERAKIEYADLLDGGAKYFKTLEDMYNKIDIDLLIIASPIQYHSEQACYAMEHGSHVLVEKPVAGCIDDVMKMIEVRDKTGKHAQIGYQQCFSETVRNIKSIILSGEYGGIETMKCMVLSPRNFGYYNRNNWAGKKLDITGRPVYDSISNNAMAHFYMTLMFLAGSDMQSATAINETESKLYRANNIETFDTCITKASLESGAEMFVIVSHATKDECGVSIEIKLQDGTIINKNNEWILVTNGKESIIGSSVYSPYKKVWDMVKLIGDSSYPVQCSIESALEHTKFIETLKDITVVDFKDKKVLSDRIYVQGLQQELQKAYEEYEFPVI